MVCPPVFCSSVRGLAVLALSRASHQQTGVITAGAPLVCRPFLKWAGGKGRLLEQYEPFLPKSCSTYYEPFLGGGAVFFHLVNRIDRALLADINPELVNVYRCVKEQVDDLIDLLQGHKQHHCSDYYYELRQRHHLPSPVERAARLIYLNKTCYNGLYRENSQGQFNVPMGQYKNPAVCDPVLLRSAAAALQPTEIMEFPFETMLDWPLSAQDFVYFDPPYHPISMTSSFTRYNRYGFTATDQERLAAVFKELAAQGLRVMLSNSDCALIRKLYAGFPMHPIQASRAINSKACRRGKIAELLITSYSPEG
jgi:DNA adenine methylase